MKTDTTTETPQDREHNLLRLVGCLNSTWPQSLWIQRLSPATLIRDCGYEICEEAHRHGRPMWRARIGLHGKWVFAASMIEVIEKVLSANAAGQIREASP